MSQQAPSATFASQREQIARMVEAEAPFLEVERVIALSPLAPKHKSELWALAWALLGPQRQEQEIQSIANRAAAYQPAS